MSINLFLRVSLIAANTLQIRPLHQKLHQLWKDKVYYCITLHIPLYAKGTAASSVLIVDQTKGFNFADLWWVYLAMIQWEGTLIPLEDVQVNTRQLFVLQFLLRPPPTKCDGFRLFYF